MRDSLYYSCIQSANSRQSCAFFDSPMADPLFPRRTQIRSCFAMTNLTFQPMMESRPIREIAYEVLKHAIITGEIPAGQRDEQMPHITQSNDSSAHLAYSPR